MNFPNQHLDEDGYEADRRMHAEKDDALFETKRFIITFGQQHTHRVNGFTFDKNSVAIIKAEDEHKARDVAFELFNNKWHMSHLERHFDADNTIKYYPRGKHEAN